MRRLLLYLDTSVLSHCLAEDAPERRDASIELLETYIKLGLHDAVISPVVIDEILRTRDPKKKAHLLEIVGNLPIELLENEEKLPEIQELARLYIASEALPPRSFDDATHIAYATVSGVDAVVSWNFRHMANMRRESLIQAVNLRQGFTKGMRIITPMEVLSDASIEGF
ncbi:MAG: hypothetical protein GHCLOJNM_00259 [bacterium]|nr:hypothetical protein [bacterium]